MNSWWIVLFVVLVALGCASADPGFGPASPTSAEAAVAELPPVARALTTDPAPEPTGGDEMSGHGDMATPAPTSEPSPVDTNDEDAEFTTEGGHDAH